MVRLACDFTFDDQIYVVAAEVDRAFDVTGLKALDNTGRPRAADVHEQCALIGVLVESGIAFDYFENATKLGPLTMSIVSAVVRGRDKALASLRSAGLAAGDR